MAKTKNTIEKQIKQFREAIAKDIPVKKLLLYGSYAKGTARADSDIDIMVVIDRKPRANKIKMTAQLFKYAMKINPNIEPRCIFWDEYKNPPRASILEEIIKTSKTI